jgi:hypothetical protein
MGAQARVRAGGCGTRRTRRRRAEWWASCGGGADRYLLLRGGRVSSVEGDGAVKSWKELSVVGCCGRCLTMLWREGGGLV